MKFQVDRKTWHRGHGANSALCMPDGMMCCFGHLGLELGYTKKEMLNKDLLIRLGTDRSNISSIAQSDIARINDNLFITDQERENLLTQEFAKYNIEVSFIN